MKKTMLFIFGLLFVSESYSQEKKAFTSFKHEVGINAGFTTGAGFSYRRWYDKIGFQITGLPVKTDETTIYNGAVTFLYSFKEKSFFRFYSYLGNNIVHFNGTEDAAQSIFPDPFNNNYYDYDDPNFYSRRKKFTHYNLGMGSGVSFGKEVAVNIMLGYGFYDVFGSLNMYPTAEIGLYYRFNRKNNNSL
jgi:hypothetical protein